MSAAPYLSAGVHIDPDTSLSFRSHPDDNRVVVLLGDHGVQVAVFLPRAELDRLAGVIAEAQESLSASAVKVAA
ncbi:hypothetical protein [Micromonospora sp. KC721]|uniref:hypothetical protein n=1 Tax=Micromonospora sp. KC721 TaxID=2530380 RepID=UPI00104597D6|nr:hypothetical protein [Micromonospora sp. KC721]TDB69744.1 hypothetical protein E1182_29075 [Micromonospora sp. KC721]